MPGLNTTGLNKTSDYFLGRGRIYFATIDATTGKPDANGFRFLGNAPTFSTTVETEQFTHQNSFKQVRETDARATTSREFGFTFSLDELNAQNWALFTAGSVVTIDNPHDTTFTDAIITADVVLGNYYQLTTGAGVPVMNLGDAGVVYTLEKSGSPDVLLVEGTDYTINEETGLVHILSTASNIANGDQLEFTISTGASVARNPDSIQAATAQEVRGVLRFEGVDGLTGREFVLTFHQASLSADGEATLITDGDEVTVFNFTGVAEVNNKISTAGGKSQVFECVVNRA